jgi:hypothetical protein
MSVLGTFTISEFALVKVIINLDGESHVVVKRRGFRANEHNGISNGRLKALLELVKLRLVEKLTWGKSERNFAAYDAHEPVCLSAFNWRSAVRP